MCVPVCLTASNTEMVLCRAFFRLKCEKKGICKSGMGEEGVYNSTLYLSNGKLVKSHSLSWKGFAQL